MITQYALLLEWSILAINNRVIYTRIKRKKTELSGTLSSM